MKHFFAKSVRIYFVKMFYFCLLFCIMSFFVTIIYAVESVLFVNRCLNTNLFTKEVESEKLQSEDPSFLFSIHPVTVSVMNPSVDLILVI